MARGFVIASMVVSVVLLLLGQQKLSVVDYDLTVRLGLQESPERMEVHGVHVHRAFGAGDSIVYIPLVVASLSGLWLSKRWALLTTAAVAGIPAYLLARGGALLGTASIASFGETPLVVDTILSMVSALRDREH